MPYVHIDEAKIAAFHRARENGRGYAYAVEWPHGLCTVEDNKPLLRSADMKVIECTEEGRTLLA